MAKIILEIPEEILHDKKTTPEEKGKILLKMAAMELYKQTDSSHGYCAQVAGMYIGDFIQYLGEHKISIYDYYTEEELERELELLRRVVG
ncbi:MAG: UPF0175 family protein [Selenomonadaceae bacterium]|nr:UPF0175 family protein [Selenomonadaceae bacterium]